MDGGGLKSDGWRPSKGEGFARALLDETHALHKRGFNCAEAAVWALSRYWDMDMETSVATGLGGGIARSGGTCGAVTGAILALGRKVGRREPGDEAGKSLAIRLGQEVIEGFVKETGAADCREIIGFVLKDPDGSSRYAAGGFKTGKCQDAVDRAVRLAIAAWENTGA